MGMRMSLEPWSVLACVLGGGSRFIPRRRRYGAARQILRGELLLTMVVHDDRSKALLRLEALARKQARERLVAKPSVATLAGGLDHDAELDESP